jgi:hypothetical protein
MAGPQTIEANALSERTESKGGGLRTVDIGLKTAKAGQTALFER